jgi:hypothetical protein
MISDRSDPASCVQYLPYQNVTRYRLSLSCGTCVLSSVLHPRFHLLADNFGLLLKNGRKTNCFASRSERGVGLGCTRCQLRCPTRSPYCASLSGIARFGLWAAVRPLRYAVRFKFSLVGYLPPLEVFSYLFHIHSLLT